VAKGEKKSKKRSFHEPKMGTFQNFLPKDKSFHVGLSSPIDCPISDSTIEAARRLRSACVKRDLIVSKEAYSIFEAACRLRSACKYVYT
jgi:hypothetical protein